MNLRGKFTTDAEGRFWFSSVMMVGYPIPTDGVVGRLLARRTGIPTGPAHLHALIFKPGFKVLISQVYDPDDPHIDTDVQFGVTKRCSATSSATTSRTLPMPQSASPGIRSTTPT